MAQRGLPLALGRRGQPAGLDARRLLFTSTGPHTRDSSPRMCPGIRQEALWARAQGRDAHPVPLPSDLGSLLTHWPIVSRPGK